MSYVILQIPRDKKTSLLENNGQIVKRTYQDLGELISIKILDGIKSSFTHYSIPLSWTREATNEEQSHGFWLEETNMKRNKYVPIGKKETHLLDYYGKEFDLAFETLIRSINPDCNVAAYALSENILDKVNWMMAADLLEEEGFDVGLIRKYL